METIEREGWPFSFLFFFRDFITGQRWMERRNGVVASRKWMMFSLPVTSLSSLGAQSIDIDSGWEFASPRRPLSVDDLRSPLLITFRGCGGGGAQWICNWDVILVVSDKSSPIAFLFFAVAFHDPAQWWLDPAPRRCRPFFFFFLERKLTAQKEELLGGVSIAPQRIRTSSDDWSEAVGSSFSFWRVPFVYGVRKKKS